ncbi:MAG: thioredoxin family protein [Theionarchaea archaeon]|nr:thioredoxin family protein [Theionarchaea archaeon]
MNEDYFNKGKTFKEYAESTDLEELYRNASIKTEDEEFFSTFNAKVLCISARWCGDCRREVPLMAYISERSGWDFRIFGMEENSVLMEKYTTDGKNVIPVFAFFDEAFKEIGRFIEKPPDGKTTPEVLREILESSSGEFGVS